MTSPASKGNGAKGKGCRDTDAGRDTSAVVLLRSSTRIRLPGRAWVREKPKQDGAKATGAVTTVL